MSLIDKELHRRNKFISDPTKEQVNDMFQQVQTNILLNGEIWIKNQKIDEQRKASWIDHHGQFGSSKKE